MEISTPIWKSNLVLQLKQQKYQQNTYGNIIEHCMLISIWYFCCLFIELDNKLIETNCLLQTQCRKFETDVNQLRLANAGLEKASVARYIPSFGKF